MANDTDGLVLALAIDGLTLGDDQLRAIGSSLLALVRYHERKYTTMNEQVRIYNTAKAMAESSDVGLCYVPTLARMFPELKVIELQNHLLQLDRSNLIELRPDSKSYYDPVWHRDSPCPPGPNGSVLAWIRICNDND
jgi:hypothetical protein